MWYLLLLSIILTACAPLSKHESIIGDAGEVLGRAILCPITLCISEVGFYNNWKDEQRKEEYRRWYYSLTPEQQEREDQRQHERSLASMQALGMMQFGRPFLQSPKPQMAPLLGNQIVPAPAIRHRPMQCTTQMIGNQLYTNCN